MHCAPRNEAFPYDIVRAMLIVQVLSFDITLVFPVLILVGVIAFWRRGR